MLSYEYIIEIYEDEVGNWRYGCQDEFKKWIKGGEKLVRHNT